MMMKRTLMMSALTTALLSGGLALAAEQAQVQEKAQAQVQEKAQAQVQEKAQAQKRERVYGSQLMTRKERVEYRARMRAAKTAEEREQIRKEHHESMQARAKERGVTLPDEPPMRGGGMMAPGGGMGPGGGMRGGNY